eukprot:762760-Hanusia_phi.AAC.19
MSTIFASSFSQTLEAPPSSSSILSLKGLVIFWFPAWSPQILILLQTSSIVPEPRKKQVAPVEHQFGVGLSISHKTLVSDFQRARQPELTTCTQQVEDIVDGWASSTCGLIRVGDLLLSVDDTQIESIADVLRLIPGQ